MPIEIQVALILGGATVIGAIIATSGVAAIVWHRRIVIDLAKEVEAYHAHEGWLVAKLIKNDGEQPTEALIRHRRGALRSQANHVHRPSMTAKRAKRIRRRYLSFE